MKNGIQIIYEMWVNGKDKIVSYTAQRVLFSDSQTRIMFVDAQERPKCAESMPVSKLLRVFVGECIIQLPNISGLYSKSYEYIGELTALDQEDRNKIVATKFLWHEPQNVDIIRFKDEIRRYIDVSDVSDENGREPNFTTIIDIPKEQSRGVNLYAAWVDGTNKVNWTVYHAEPYVDGSGYKIEERRDANWYPDRCFDKSVPASVMDSILECPTDGIHGLTEEQKGFMCAMYSTTQPLDVMRIKVLDHASKMLQKKRNKAIQEASDAAEKLAKVNDELMAIATRGLRRENK